MDIAMWGKALRVIPRIDQDEWSRLDIISRWLISTRAAVLIITFIPTIIAGLLAFRADQFNFLLWLLLAVGLLMAHATNNLVNDLTDYYKGVDRDNYFRTQYGVQPIDAGLMTMRQSFIYAAVTGLIALAAGAALIYLRGGLTFWLLLLGVFFVLFYTWPLKYIGLGELAVIIVWGPLMVGGGYYVITGDWSWNAAIASLPYALGATTVIFGKHIDKISADKAKGIRTLPVLLGERNARYTAIAMMILQYLFIAYLVAIGYFTVALLAVVIAIRQFRLAYKVFSQPRPVAPPPEYPADAWPLWYVSFAFYHNRTFGIWYLLGLLVDVILQRFIL